LRSFDSLSSECRKALIRIAHKPWSCPSLYSHASISRFQQTGQGQDRSVEWRGQRVGKMGKAYGVRMELVWNMYGTTRSQHANSRRGTGWDYRACKEGRRRGAGVQEPTSAWGRGGIHRAGRARPAGGGVTLTKHLQLFAHTLAWLVVIGWP
jgi:hypothetical protein